MTIPEFLEEKSIVILGFGKQGKATFNYIRKHFPKKEIAISDRNENIDKSDLDDNVKLNLGKNYLKDIENYDIIIKAPGVVLKNEDISKYREKIITDYELLIKYTPGIKIGITGTKGKSTTSTIMYEALKKQGKKTLLVGNIGNPIFNEIDNITEDTYTVIEVSSHMLEFVTCSPHISVLLDIFPEHLDHVDSIEDYINAKFNIAKYQTENDFFIYNAENELMKNHDFKYKRNDIAVFLNDVDKSLKNKIYLENGNIYFNNKILMNENEPRKIKGKHMLNNMMFILAISELLGLNLEKTIDAIKNTEPLNHRMEYIGKFDGIEFYDDAIATIPIATINCINALENVNTLICGGMDRGVDQLELIEYLKKSKVKNVICMPETGYKIYENLKRMKNVVKVENLKEAVKVAKKVTRKNTICLLSPAASSYNQFNSFEEKGNKFKEYIFEE